MSNIRIDVISLGLDDLGRVVLSDDLLDAVDQCDHIVSAGANTECGGYSSNASCTNYSCGGSSNGWCTNTLQCDGTANYLYCRNDVSGG